MNLDNICLAMRSKAFDIQAALRMVKGHVWNALEDYLQEEGSLRERDARSMVATLQLQHNQQMLRGMDDRDTIGYLQFLMDNRSHHEKGGQPAENTGGGAVVKSFDPKAAARMAVRDDWGVFYDYMEEKGGILRSEAAFMHTAWGQTLHHLHARARLMNSTVVDEGAKYIQQLMQRFKSLDDICAVLKGGQPARTGKPSKPPKRDLRGQPCKPGYSAARTGCVPRGSKPKPDEGKPGKPSVSEAASKIREMLIAGKPDMEKVKDIFLSLSVDDIKAVKDELGLKNKPKLADEIKEEADARRRDRRGRRQAEREPEAAGDGVASEAERPSDEATGGEGTHEREPTDNEVAADLSRTKDRVLKRVDRYRELMLKKGMKSQVEWMDALKEHIGELGVQGALDALGEEKAGRGKNEPIQYVGAYDDLVQGTDGDSKFIKQYLANSGIVLAGPTVDPNLSVISGWSKANIAAEGREALPEAPTDYVPSDQTFKNKLEESQALPGLESSEDIHKVVGEKVTQFTPEVIAKLDEKYGKGQWIVKSYGEEAYAGFGIFFPQRVKQIQADSKALMSEAKEVLGERGYKVAKDQAGNVVGVRKDGKTFAVGTEEYGELPKTMQKYGRQAVQASHAVKGAVLPSTPEDSIKNDYGVSFIRDKEGVPTGITNYDGKQYAFDSPGYKKIEEQEGGAAGHAIHRAQEADEWRRKGYSNEPKFMVQPAFKAVGVSDADRAMGATWETAKEGRVHCVTRNGKASAVPYATLVGRGDDLPAVFQNDDSRAMEKAVEDAINKLPESERAGQLYAPDVMKTKDGWKVIELNPSAAGGGSDWLGRNPFVIDALVSHMTGREPQHVKFVRDLMRKEGIKLPGLPAAAGKPGSGGKSKSRGGPCERGETAARSGCVPAGDSGGRKPSGREGGGQFAGKGQLGAVFSVKHGNMESKYSLHSDKRIAGPSLPLKNYKQQDDHSCGFVAALTVARYFDPSISSKDVLKAVRPTKSGGIDGKSLRESLKKIGIDARYRDDLDLSTIRKYVERGTPVLLTVYPPDWSSDHWVAVEGFDEDRIYLTNYRSLPIKEFKKEWYDRGEGLVCQKRSKTKAPAVGAPKPKEPGRSLRGQPCEPGYSAAQTGCIPRGEQGSSEQEEQEEQEHTQESVTEHIRDGLLSGKLDYDKLGESLLTLKKSELIAIKRDLGFKLMVYGKEDLASKITDMAKKRLEAEHGRRGQGGRGNAEPSHGDVGEVAEGTGGSDHAGHDEEGDRSDESAGEESSGRTPVQIERVNQKIDKYKGFFERKGLHHVAGWMDQLKEHINSVGVDSALEQLGPEKEGEGENVQYGGYDLDGKWDADFVEGYLERNGISLIKGSMPEGPKRAISTVSSSSDEEGLHSRGRNEDVFPKLQTLRDKLEETQHLPGLEESEDLGKLMGQKFGSPVRAFTPEVWKKLDETYGEGKWIVKSYDDNAYSGFGIYFPQFAKQVELDAKNTLWQSGGELAKYGFKHLRDDKGTIVGIEHEGGDKYEFGTKKYEDTIHGDARKWGDEVARAAPSEKGAELPLGRPDEKGVRKVARYMAGPAFPVVGISNEERAQGVMFKKGQEGRVHIVTKNGKAEIVQHSTWLKHESLPVVFESEETRAMAQAAVDAINALPASERKGQLYAPDVVKTKDGYKVVEANPANEAGASGYLQDNPFIIDSYVSQVTGREPSHVKFIRKLLTEYKS